MDTDPDIDGFKLNKSVKDVQSSPKRLPEVSPSSDDLSDDSNVIDSESVNDNRDEEEDGPSNQSPTSNRIQILVNRSSL